MGGPNFRTCPACKRLLVDTGMPHDCIPTDPAPDSTSPVAGSAADGTCRQLNRNTN